MFFAGQYLNVIGFEKGVSVTPEMLFRMKLLFGPITAFINLAGVIIFCFFHYDKAEHARIRRELAKRKERLTGNPAGDTKLSVEGD